MVVKRFAKMVNGQVENIILLDTDNDEFDRTGYVELEDSDTITDKRSTAIGVAPPEIGPLRVAILSAKIDDDTATLPEIREYLKLRDR
jgi:hypothetical protein